MCRIGYRNENAQEDYECVCFLGRFVRSPADPIKDGMPIRMCREPRERPAMPTTDRWRIKPIKSGGINKKPQLRWAPQCLGKVTSPLDNLTTLIFSCGSAYPFSWREPSLALSVSARKASGPATYVFWDPFSAVSVWQLSSFASEFVASTGEGRKSLPIVTLGTSWPKSSRSNTLLPFVPSSTSLEKGQQSFHPFKSIRVSIAIHPWIYKSCRWYYVLVDAPGCDSAMMKSSVTAATDLSPSEGRSPVLSGENVPLIDIESADNTPSPQLTTVVIESEWMSERTVETRQVHFAGIPRKSRIPSHPELALNPLSLAAHDSSSSSLISPLPKSWSAGFDPDNSWNFQG